MQQSVPMPEISEINMQQTFHVLQYVKNRLIEVSDIFSGLDITKTDAQ